MCCLMIGITLHHTFRQHNCFLDLSRLEIKVNQGNKEIKAKLEKLDLFHVEQYVALVKKMEAIKEGDGTLLDNMMFMLGSGLSSGELHICSNLPTVIAGSAGGRLNTGQHVRYPEGTPIANLWLSMADVMRVKRERIGDSTGRLRDVFRI